MKVVYQIYCGYEGSSEGFFGSGGPIAPTVYTDEKQVIKIVNSLNSQSQYDEKYWYVVLNVVN